MFMEWLSILEKLGIVLGLVLAFWGLFHQLIVGSAASMFKGLGSTELRIVVMSWVAQGAFLSFCGVLSSVLLFFHGLNSAAVQTALLLCGTALIFLSIHIYISGIKKHLRPLRIGAFLQLFYGIYLLVLIIPFYTAM